MLEAEANKLVGKKRDPGYLLLNEHRQTLRENFERICLKMLKDVDVKVVEFKYKDFNKSCLCIRFKKNKNIST